MIKPYATQEIDIVVYKLISLPLLNKTAYDSLVPMTKHSGFLFYFVFFYK